MSLNPLHRRILELSYRHSLSHIGSCLGCVDILDGIYAGRKADEPVILSMGHGGLGLYVVLEKWLGKNADDLLARHGVHPTKNVEDGIYCSVGSLGQGLSVAVGRALSDRNRLVHCVISDGEAAEGVVYESLNFARQQRLTNLQIHLSLNGFGAYRSINRPYQNRVLRVLWTWLNTHLTFPDHIPFLVGQAAHYYTMTEADWEWVQAQEVQS